jgi:DNA-binding transcriptional ArsR family regulator
MNAHDAAKVLAALGNEVRLTLWRVLTPHSPPGLPAAAIASMLSIAPSTLSFHLQLMTRAGLLTQRRSSRSIIYAVNTDTTDALYQFLASAGGAGTLLPGEPGDILREG